MQNKHIHIILLFIFLATYSVRAQITYNQLITSSDSTKIERKNKQALKTITELTDSSSLKPFKPDPLKVVWMGSIIPGYGQIMNKKYWKLPIVYGGFLGCAYALTWNGARYQTYKTAYKDITDSDPTTNSFLEILPKGYTINSPGVGGLETWKNTLKTKQDNFRRYRDLSVIFTIGYYALTLVDAYVDAQLYDFDISPDLSMRLEPALLQNAYGQRNAIGMQCCISLK